MEISTQEHLAGLGRSRNRRPMEATGVLLLIERLTTVVVQG